MNKLKLGECCLSISDGDHMPPPKSMEGVPFLTISNIDTNNHLNFSNTMFVPQEYWEKIDERRKAHEGDVLLSVTGSYGIPVYIDFEKDFVFQRHIAILKPDPDILSGRYLYYLLKSPSTKKLIDKLVTGAIQKTLGLDMIRKMSFDIPSIPEQNYITNILSQIDKLIDNNISICSDLEAIVKLLYDYWFVQFDFPDENGKPYKSSGGKMVWNEELKREIPEGWEMNRLGDLISYSRGVSYTGNDMCDSGTPIISLASIDRSGRYIPDGIKYYNQEYPSSKVLKPYDLVMANTDMTQERAVMGKIIFVPDIFEGDILSTHHITKIVIVDELKSYLMMTTQTDWFHKYIKGFSSGTNVLGMDMVGFEDYMLVYPSHEVLMRFDSIVHDYYGKIFEIYRENFELASLRDFLLPMLMNGQVSIKDIR